jgi:recombination protein RecA
MSEQTKAQRFKVLEGLSKALDKAHTEEKKGRIVKNSLIRLGDRPVLRVPCINTGFPTFDYEVLQYGGIPRGRIVEIFGPESSGKTTTTLQIIAEAQRAGGIAAFIDAEHKLEPTYAAQLGVNLDELVFNQPNSGEEALDTVDKMVESHAVDLVVVDSAAALVPEAELAGDIGDAHVGLQARMLSQAMRILTAKCADPVHLTTIIFINQIREKIGVMFGNPETTPGGRALKFYSSVRLSITRKEAIWEGTKENIIGHSIDLRCVKNGGGIPFRRTQLNLIYPGEGRKAGFDKIADTVSYASKNNVFEMKGSWYWMDLGNFVLDKEGKPKKDKDGKQIPVGPEQLANGLDNLQQFLRDNPNVLEIVVKKVATMIKDEEKTQDATAGI